MPGSSKCRGRVPLHLFKCCTWRLGVRQNPFLQSRDVGRVRLERHDDCIVHNLCTAIKPTGHGQHDFGVPSVLPNVVERLHAHGRHVYVDAPKRLKTAKRTMSLRCCTFKLSNVDGVSLGETNVLKLESERITTVHSGWRASHVLTHNSQNGGKFSRPVCQ